MVVSRSLKNVVSIITHSYRKIEGETGDDLLVDVLTLTGNNFCGFCDDSLHPHYSELDGSVSRQWKHGGRKRFAHPKKYILSPETNSSYLESTILGAVPFGLENTEWVFYGHGMHTSCVYETKEEFLAQVLEKARGCVESKNSCLIMCITALMRVPLEAPETKFTGALTKLNFFTRILTSGSKPKEFTQPLPHKHPKLVDSCSLKNVVSVITHSYRKIEGETGDDLLVDVLTLTGNNFCDDSLHPHYLELDGSVSRQWKHGGRKKFAHPKKDILSLETNSSYLESTILGAVPFGLENTKWVFYGPGMHTSRVYETKEEFLAQVLEKACGCVESKNSCLIMCITALMRMPLEAPETNFTRVLIKLNVFTRILKSCFITK